MPSRDVIPTSAEAGVPDIPPCTNCQRFSQVHRLTRDDVSSGIQYWRCDACVYVWATQDGQDLRLHCAYW